MALAVNESTLAAIFGVDARTIRNWIAAGLPVKRKGRTLSFALPEAVRWVRDRDRAAADARVAAAVARQADPESSKARRSAAAAGLAELKLERERGAVVSVEAVKAEWGQMMAATREAVMALPAVAVQAALIPKRLEAALESLCRDALVTAHTAIQSAAGFEPTTDETPGAARPRPVVRRLTPAQALNVLAGPVSAWPWRGDDPERVASYVRSVAAEGDVIVTANGTVWRASIWSRGEDCMAPQERAIELPLEA